MDTPHTNGRVIPPGDSPRLSQGTANLIGTGRLTLPLVAAYAAATRWAALPDAGASECGEVWALALVIVVALLVSAWPWPGRGD